MVVTPCLKQGVFLERMLDGLKLVPTKEVLMASVFLFEQHAPPLVMHVLQEFGDRDRSRDPLGLIADGILGFPDALQQFSTLGVDMLVAVLCHTLAGLVALAKFELVSVGWYPAHRKLVVWM